jgi:hypothetical protein
MLRKFISTLILTVTVASGSVFADTLIVSGISPQANNSPARGMKQTAVESRWGQPISKNEPVGSPPIASWEYSTFVVYFEHDHVVHSVAKR